MAPPESEAVVQPIARDNLEIQKLQAYAADEKEIPWIRIYRLPYFVFFSHQKHLQAGADCEACHGPVGEREVLWKEKEISMDACVECHRARQASIACNLCHELNQ
ncbi:MAG: cytochrome c3 family protein [Acidobacteriota bacterium]